MSSAKTFHLENVFGTSRTTVQFLHADGIGIQLFHHASRHLVTAFCIFGKNTYVVGNETGYTLAFGIGRGEIIFEQALTDKESRRKRG